MTGGELAAVVAKMPEADQQAIRATVREILQERDQRSAGADRSKSATASGSPLTQDGSSGNGQQGAGLRSRDQTGAAKNPMARANSMKPPKAQIARFTGLAIGK